MSHVNRVRAASASNVLQPIIRLVGCVQPPPHPASGRTNLEKIIFLIVYPL